jgi:glucosamine kinase
MTRYFLGIDGGGSHCRARLTNAQGVVLGEGRAGPANSRAGFEPMIQSLSDASNEALAASGLDIANLGEIAMGAGLAGISRIGIREKLAGLALPFASTRFDSDAVIANLGAHRGEDGAVLILGTGSIAHIRQDGRSYSIGGYGFPISDEGSGAALGLSAMRHALRALDGRTKPTPLSAAITARFGHDTARAIEWMDNAIPRDYGSLAPVVLDYAEAGDEIAHAIVEEAARHIERFIETVFQRGVQNCSLLGGLAPRIQPWLKARTVARLSRPEGDALDGALYLAGLRLPATLDRG